MAARQRRIETVRHIAVALGVALVIYYLIQYVGPKFGYQPPEQPVMAHE